MANTLFNREHLTLDRFLGSVPQDYGTPHNRFDWHNIISVFLMGMLPAVGGSAITFLLATFFIWAVWSWLRHHYKFERTQSDQILAITFTTFFLLELATAVIGDDPAAGIWKSLSLIPFVSLWFVIPRLRAGSRLDYLQIYSAGAGFGAIGAAVFGAIELLVAGRAEGGAGNPAVFGMMCLALTAVAGLNINSPAKRLRILAFTAIFCGLFGVTMSLTRGVWLASPAVVILLFLYSPSAWRSLVSHKWALLLTFAAISVAMVAFGSGIERRILQTVREISQLANTGDSDVSIGPRLEMWQAGIEAFKASPIWGHGIQNRMEALNAFSATEFSFSHAHNGFLTFAIDGGLVLLLSLVGVLAMPVLVSWRVDQDFNYRKRLFLALSISTIYIVCGLTQIMFKHDIMDSFFIFNTIIVAASIPSQSGPETERHGH